MDLYSYHTNPSSLNHHDNKHLTPPYWGLSPSEIDSEKLVHRLNTDGDLPPKMRTLLKEILAKNKFNNRRALSLFIEHIHRPGEKWPKFEQWAQHIVATQTLRLLPHVVVGYAKQALHGQPWPGLEQALIHKIHHSRDTAQTITQLLESYVSEALEANISPTIDAAVLNSGDIALTMRWMMVKRHLQGNYGWPELERKVILAAKEGGEDWLDMRDIAEKYWRHIRTGHWPELEQLIGRP